MGKRREPRKDIRVAVRIFGTDRGGQLFSEKVFTVNVSQQGVELSGVQAQPNVDEIVGITHGVTKAHFRVKWVGQPGSDKAGHLGLLNLSPGKNLWDFPLPPPGYDATVRDARDRRASSRVKCASSVEVYPTGEAAPIRTRTADLSLGGCFLEMPNPLPPGTQIRIALGQRFQVMGERRSHHQHAGVWDRSEVHGDDGARPESTEAIHRRHGSNQDLKS
jgi:hypothetical protein